MGTRIDSNVAPQQQGNAVGDQQIMEEKYAWQMDRAVQHNPTVDLMVYTITGAKPSAHVQGTLTQVSGLSDLEAYVEPFTVRRAEKYGVTAEEGDRLFVLYDIPDAAHALGHDRVRIRYSEGSVGGSEDVNLYDVVNYWYKQGSGRWEIQGRIVGKTT
jgi:hypothetical protein